MKRAEIICALALVAVAGIGVAEAVRLGFGWGPSGPRAGFFPFWLSLILGLCSLTNLGKAIRMSAATGGPPKPFVSRKLLKPVLAVFLPMTAAVLLFEVVGFYLAAALYLAFYMRWMGRHSWPAVLAVGILFPVATFLILERWFLIPLPKGLFEKYLPF
ncbi:MAG: tripartite tricarboxylate transporter TctB family protein [candidate division NC10 bacterium]|nr:tripartite tricarboxylate transporter TctB family protein [candidate division NC10 bacterium]MBI2457533.1 tripartite tricarboxylate transporter TctB family protein [candidate division NC10 bacterium]